MSSTPPRSSPQGAKRPIEAVPATLVSLLSETLASDPALVRLLAKAMAEAMSAHADRSHDNILRLPEVMRRTGLKRSSLYAKIAKGSFPSQILLSINMVGWRESAIDAWVANPR